MDIRMFDVSYTSVGKVALKLACFSDLHMEAFGDNSEAKHDLDEAASEGRRLSFNGDNMDMIYDKDPRYNRARDKGDYDAKLNKDTEFLYEFLKPYVDSIDVIGTGNHEGSVFRHYHYDINRGVIALLNMVRDKKLCPVYQGEYRGLQYYRLTNAKGGSGRPFVLMRHHLRGGSAPVTKGMIDIARLSDGWDAHFYWGGHKHSSITDNGRMRYGVTGKGHMWQRTIKAFITPGYQESVKDTTTDIDSNGVSVPYEETFYTGTPKGYGIIDVIPMHSDAKEMVKIRCEVRT